MKKRLYLSFAAVTFVVVGVTALLLGGIGGSGKPVAGDVSTDKGRAEVLDVSASAECNWGLSFQQEGMAPIANATAQYLKKYNGYYIDERDGEKRIYLTFDAGYENGYTEKILDVLKKEKVPAAFFLVGNYIEDNPEIVKRMEGEGHTVANHTMHHPDMAVISDKGDFQKELQELESVYKDVTGKEMKKFYRPPQGKYSESNLKMAHELGYTTVFWSLAYVDWYENDQPTREEALNILNKRIHPGAIVLLHSTSKTNGEIMEELIKGWKEQGYQFCSIEQLEHHIGKEGEGK